LAEVRRSSWLAGFHDSFTSAGAKLDARVLPNLPPAVAMKPQSRQDDCHEPAGVVSMPPQMSSQPTNEGSQPTAANRAELAALDQFLDKIRALKHGMMRELPTGMTRLVSPGHFNNNNQQTNTNNQI
jgi:hypothetical protein